MGCEKNCVRGCCDVFWIYVCVYNWNRSNVSVPNRLATKSLTTEIVFSVYARRFHFLYAYVDVSIFFSLFFQFSTLPFLVIESSFVSKNSLTRNACNNVIMLNSHKVRVCLFCMFFLDRFYIHAHIQIYFKVMIDKSSKLFIIEHARAHTHTHTFNKRMKLNV